MCLWHIKHICLWLYAKELRVVPISENPFFIDLSVLYLHWLRTPHPSSSASRGHKWSASLTCPQTHLAEICKPLACNWTEWTWNSTTTRKCKWPPVDLEAVWQYSPDLSSYQSNSLILQKILKETFSLMVLYIRDRAAWHLVHNTFLFCI